MNSTWKGRTKKPSSPSSKVKLALARLRLIEIEEAEARQWKPFPGPQQMALESTADVIGFGGSAGGGKSSMLLGKAMLHHHEAILFRRHYGEFSEIIKQGRQLFNGIARFNKNDKTFWFRDEGKFIALGAIDHEEELEKQRGKPHDYIGIDEATDWPESQIRFLAGWNRTTRPGQRCQMVLTFNPPKSKRGQWILKFFAPWLDRRHPNPAQPGELRWFAMKPTPDGSDAEEVEVPDFSPIVVNGETIHPSSRTFIPSRVTDNPALMATDYVRKLQALPEPLRSQLLYGSFDAGLEEDPWQVIPTRWVQLSNQRWVARRDARLAKGLPNRPDEPMTAIGEDVAHGGKDKTTVAPRYGTWFDELIVVPGVETPTGEAAALVALNAWDGNAFINVDAIGVGAACHEALERHGVNAYAIGSRRSEYRDKSGAYRTILTRDEMYWRIRDALDPEGDPETRIDLPPDAELLSDLCEATYEITTAGIKVEKKDDIKKRIGRSPDRGDAVCLAMLPEPAKSHQIIAGGRRTQVETAFRR